MLSSPCRVVLKTLQSREKIIVITITRTITIITIITITIIVGNMPSVQHSTIRFFRCYQLPPEEVFVESSSVRVTEVGSHTRPTNVRPKMVGTGRAGC